MERPDKIIDEAVSQIVAETHPREVVLFGSAARGEFGPDSDLDFLVVMPDGTDRLGTARRLHRRLQDLECAKDIVVVVESDVAEQRNNPCMIVHAALSEGQVLYHAA